MESTWTSKRLERIQLDQSLWESQIALQTLLGIAAMPAGQASNSPTTLSSSEEKCAMIRSFLNIVVIATLCTSLPAAAETSSVLVRTAQASQQPISDPLTVYGRVQPDPDLVLTLPHAGLITHAALIALGMLYWSTSRFVDAQLAAGLHKTADTLQQALAELEPADSVPCSKQSWRQAGRTDCMCCSATLKEKFWQVT
jgi:hypothetical protein